MLERISKELTASNVTVCVDPSAEVVEKMLLRSKSNCDGHI